MSGKRLSVESNNRKDVLTIFVLCQGLVVGSKRPILVVDLDRNSLISDKTTAGICCQKTSAYNILRF